MIKRISIISCLVLLLVVTMAVPAFAVDNHFDIPSITLQPVDLYLCPGEHGYFTVCCDGDVLSYQWQVSENGINWTNSFSEGMNTASLKVSANTDFNCRLFRCLITFSDGTVLVSNEAARFTYPLPFLKFVSRCIHFVTSWVGSIISALVSPNGAFYSLLPVIAIGIAVTGLFLVIKIFKSFSWGL